MTPFKQRLHSALAWVDASRPPNVKPAGWRAFQLGLVFMPTSALLAGLGLLASLTLWRPVNEPRPLSRPMARWLLLLATWLAVTMLAGGGSLEVKLRLANWLPFFWLLLAAVPYLATVPSRERLGLLVLVATVPALLVGLLQALLLLSGPWTALGGLLNWDLPARYAAEGAGVFPNPNFTAAWYTMALPIAAAHGLQRSQWPAWGLLALLSTGVVLSGSRTALVGSTVGVLLLAWRRFWKPVLLLAALQTALVTLALLLPSDHGIGPLAQRLSGGLASKLAPMLRGAGSTAAEAIASGRDPYRSELFPQAIQFIQHHPLLGLAEPLLGQPPVEPPALLTHTHNVAFQLSIQHGLPAALLLVGLVLWLLLRGWQARPQGIDRALLSSAVAAVWLHAYDIPSFDSRNNMLGWLLLSCCWAVGGGAAGASTPPDPDEAQNGPGWGDA